MPPAFERCRKKPGSRIRTEKPSKGTYRRVCITKGGKRVKGHVQTKKR